MAAELSLSRLEFCRLVFTHHLESPVSECPTSNFSLSMKWTVFFVQYRHSTVQYSTVQYSTVQYSTVQLTLAFNIKISIQYNVLYYMHCTLYSSSSKHFMFSSCKLVQKQPQMEQNGHDKICSKCQNSLCKNQNTNNLCHSHYWNAN